MARFSVEDDGDEAQAQARPSNKHPVAAASNSRDCPTPSAAAAQRMEPRDRPTPSNKRPRLNRPVAAAAPLVIADDSDSSLSDSFDDSSTEESGEYVPPQPTPRNGDVSQTVEASGSDASSGPISVTLTDPDVLDCPICCVPLCSPVYQCENGHIACASCCTTMKNKCASCSWPIGYNRCRAIEKVLESVRVACRNLPHGCLQKFSYSKKLAHEKICNYAAISCPHTGCDFSSFSQSVYSHFALKHSQCSKLFCFNEVISLSLDKDQKHVFLQEKNMSTVFILNWTVETVGSFVNVVCVAPAAANKAYLFDLTATVGESSIKLKSVVDVMPKWMAEPPTKIYLIVPKAFISISGVMKLELQIFRNEHHNIL